MPKLLLAIDVGTSRVKVVVFNEHGQTVASGTDRIVTFSSHPTWAEQDPNSWWLSVLKIIRKLIRNNPEVGKNTIAISVTGQMHGPVLLDKDGAPLGNCIIWQDRRALKETAQIDAKMGKELYNLSGYRLTPYMTAPKLLWVRNHVRRRYERSRKILLPKDFVRSRLTGDSYTDWSDANGTGLFDLRKKRWLSEAIEELGLDESRMPEIKAPFEWVGEISDTVSRRTGLKRGIPVVTGGGDDVVSIGTGALEPGQCAVNLGTSCSSFATVERPVFDPKMRLECFVGFKEDQYYLSGTTTSAGGSIDWVNRNIGNDHGYSSHAKISRQRLKPSGLFFLPYLAGERTPFWDPNAKAAILGITSTHTRNDLIQSAMEGVSFTVRTILEITEQLARPKIRTVRVAGALNYSESFMAILASILNRTLLIPREQETTALGAAMLASIGASQSSNIHEAAQKLLSWKTIVKPQRNVAAEYKEKFSKFSKLAEAYLKNMNRWT